VSFEKELEQADRQLNFMRAVVRRENDSGGPLDGVPFVVKDQICTRGVTTSAGSRIIEGYEPVFDAAVVERLEEAGAELHGKTNQDEFGFGTFCTNCAFQTPGNPNDPDRVVGGSSGGAAAAVAATDSMLVSLGESTGGSISNPAAYCGVFGITPTYGRVPRHGLVSYGNSLDKIGVLTENVELAAEALEVISGRDSRDQTTVDEPVPAFSDNLEEPSGLKIGVPEQMAGLEGIEEGVRRNFERSLEELEQFGTVEEIDVPMLDREVSVPAYYVLAMAEASTNLAKFSGMRYGAERDPEDFDDFEQYFSAVRTENFGEEAKRRIMLGTYARMAGYRDKYYVKAAEVRQKLIDELEGVFEEYDLLVSPTMPNVAPEIEEAESMPPEEVYAMDALTVGPNLAGVPMASVPNGESEGMPTGLHIVGPHWAEQRVLNLAHAYQQLRGGEQ
jgi:aspartyl-tRNA(Asn)/glutamyl-tRNA(Gln) amidotransferase subunit A